MVVLIRNISAGAAGEIARIARAAGGPDLEIRMKPSGSIVSIDPAEAEKAACEAEGSEEAGISLKEILLWAEASLELEIPSALEESVQEAIDAMAVAE